VKSNNRDDKVIEEFGSEWISYNYSEFDHEKLYINFMQYFEIFPWDLISSNAVGFDMGSGSGRWAQFVAPKVKELNCIEPSQAIDIARRNLDKFDNVNFLQETTDTCSLETNSQDFGYSLGVLHHIPDTQSALRDCATLLKTGAPFLLYLSYNFENKPLWFKLLWKLSNCLRLMISKLPSSIKKLSCNLIAISVYYPLSRIALSLEMIGANVENFPLSDYRHKPFYQCKNDALDRFGTRLEQRFSRTEITTMLENAGFHQIQFSHKTPFWCCVAIKK